MYPVHYPRYVHGTHPPVPPPCVADCVACRVQHTHKMTVDTNECMIDLVVMKVTEEQRHISTEPIWDLEDDDGKWGSWYT